MLAGAKVKQMGNISQEGLTTIEVLILQLSGSVMWPRRWSSAGEKSHGICGCHCNLCWRTAQLGLGNR